MKNQTSILNELLATLEVAYSNAKGRHWMVYGTPFRSLHLLLDDTAATLRKGADKMAETIRVLDGIPLHTMTQFVDSSQIEEALAIPDALTTAHEMRDDLNEIVAMVHGWVDVKVFDPTTENDVLNITSEIRHWILFFDGIISNWTPAIPRIPEI